MWTITLDKSDYKQGHLYELNLKHINVLQYWCMESDGNICGHKRRLKKAYVSKEILPRSKLLSKRWILKQANSWYKTEEHSQF